MVEAFQVEHHGTLAKLRRQLAGHRCFAHLARPHHAHDRKRLQTFEQFG